MASDGAETMSAGRSFQRRGATAPSVADRDFTLLYTAVGRGARFVIFFLMILDKRTTERLYTASCTTDVIAFWRISSTPTICPSVGWNSRRYIVMDNVSRHVQPRSHADRRKLQKLPIFLYNSAPERNVLDELKDKV